VREISGDKMNHLTDMELLARIDLCRSAIIEMETNMAEMNAEFGRYLEELADRTRPTDEADRYRLKYLVEKSRKACEQENQKLIRYSTMLDAALAELEARKNPDPMALHRGKIDRLLNFVLNFACSSMPKNTATYRFVLVPPYKGPTGLPRPDPLEYQVNEENGIHMTVTFYVSTEELRRFVTAAWQKKFRDLNYIGFHPAE
jgi:hypothetical protein